MSAERKLSVIIQQVTLLSHELKKFGFEQGSNVQGALDEVGYELAVLQREG